MLRCYALRIHILCYAKQNSSQRSLAFSVQTKKKQKAFLALLYLVTYDDDDDDCRTNRIKKYKQTWNAFKEYFISFL